MIQKLKDEILKAKRNHKLSFDSKVVKGLHLTLIYEKKKHLFEYKFFCHGREIGASAIGKL